MILKHKLKQFCQLSLASLVITAGLSACSVNSSTSVALDPASTQPNQHAIQTLNLVKQLDPDTQQITDKSDLTAYLLVYFKDETHSAYFATSTDGYRFTDVNNGEPVLIGKAVAEQLGVRDPHIYRGPDNAFYMALTDLHIFAKREGLRATEWERDGDKYGWGNNKNLILMKSYNLIDWTLARVPVNQLFPQAGDLGSVWAPQTIYDDTTNQLMVYFTTRQKNEPNYMVYSYANSDFTTLTTTPKQIFYYPNPKINTIDADITKIGDKYHMFYVAHDNPGNLRQAISDKINADYQFDPTKVDSEKVAAEAPNLWHRHGTDTYVLMYDVFHAKPRNNMGFAETTDFKTFKNIGRFNEPDSPMKATNFEGPKHGAVLPISIKELDRLTQYFNQP
ncbi:glycoside hydrolase family 43 protein [Catenovulum sp. 2E275]|uniref:glycoside hydrolase family 43 protein n=1 Tax=Catenovulum sp. 2E275 TaxID=2980497 RepID=UPI0021CF2906|nr:glycoside hydrolase family 43 protein [Catenovulum sp. 2E275]MCU4676554.1 glycoside hydrolase family 43 protein [Catenovulum sp. 2E275]